MCCNGGRNRIAVLFQNILNQINIIICGFHGVGYALARFVCFNNERLKRLRIR